MERDLWALVLIASVTAPVALVLLRLILLELEKGNDQRAKRSDRRDE